MPQDRRCTSHPGTHRASIRRALSIVVTGVVTAVAVGGVAITLGLALPGCGDRAVPPPDGYLLDDLALPLLDGRTFDPGTLRGKNILVNFWRPG